MNRRRSARKRGWPANLYERGGYFSWRNPMDGKEHGIGRDKREAFQQAIEANIYLAGLRDTTRLIDRVNGGGERSFGAWLDLYEGAIGDREYRPNTLKSYLSILRLIRRTMDTSMPIARVETRHIAEALASIKADNKKRLAQATRARLMDIFRAAMAEGWIQSNPVAVTEAVKVKVKRARLSWDVFREIYRQTRLEWLRNAMALAIVTAQRREEIIAVTFRDIHDGAWHCEQLKTGNRIMIPMELRLDCFGMSLADVVEQCRRTRYGCRTLIHQTRRRGNSPLGSPIFIDTLSKAFANEVARLPNADWGENNPPTFHEIRSLSERLYNAQGNIHTQDLLGHRDPRSTQLYHDARGAWVTVKIQ